MSRPLLRKSIALVTVLALLLSVFPLFSASAYADSDPVIDYDLNVTYAQSDARSMLEMINEFRTGDNAWEYAEDNSVIRHSGLRGLTYDYELERIAMQRAAELVISYSHTRPDGTKATSAYTEPFRYAAKGENIAMGYISADSVFEAWKEEYEDYAGQGHRRNMLYSSFKSVGIGHVNYNGVDFWVQEFSDMIADTAYVAPNDSETTVTVKTLESLVTNVEPEVYTSGDYEYVLDDNGDAMITACSAYGDVVIPEYIDGHKVVLLADQLFYGRSGITSVFIPATIEYLDKWAYVFSYCYDLEAINVDENNPVLTSVDGVLYSKDMSTLYNYPGGKVGQSYTVPAKTKELCCTSFARARLKKLTLENPDTRWYTYTFYADEDLVVVYKSGGASERLTVNGTDYGPTFTADPNYEPEPEDEPVPVYEPDTDDVQAANDFSIEVWSYLSDPEELTLEDEAYVKSKREQYNNMSPEAKALVEPEYLEMLVNAENKISDLKAEAASGTDTTTDTPTESYVEIPIVTPIAPPVDLDDEDPEPVVKAPGRVVIKSLKPGRRSAKLTIKKMRGVKFKVQYRIKGKKKWTTKTLKKTSFTYKKLKSGKRYQFRVRAYKTVNGVTYYGKWSKIKTVKIR